MATIVVAPIPVSNGERLPEFFQKQENYLDLMNLNYTYKVLHLTHQLLVLRL